MERDNADESNHIESSIHRRDFGDNPTNVITVNDRREPTFHPPKRPQPARCRLYPFCKARPCRLSSHQLYKREKVPPLGSGKRSMARAGGHGNQVAKMNSPLASIGNPGIDPFIQYPFELTGEMQELLKLGQSPLYFYFLVDAILPVFKYCLGVWGAPARLITQVNLNSHRYLLQQTIWSRQEEEIAA